MWRGLSNRPPRGAIIRCSVVGGCGDQFQREDGWRLVIKGRMGAPRVIVVDPVRNDSSGVNRATEHGFVQEFIAHPAVEAFAKGILGRLARRNVMPIDVMRRTPVEDRICGQFRPVAIGTEPCMDGSCMASGLFGCGVWSAAAMYTASEMRLAGRTP